MKKLLTVSLIALMTMASFAGCSPKEEAPADTPPAATEDAAAPLTDGSYSVEGTADDQGWIPMADVVIENGSIAAITFDAKDVSGMLKSEAVANGEYDMMSNGALASWTDEMAVFSQAIIDGSVDITTIVFDEEGKTDAVSGCTITVQPYVELVKTALEQAKM
ncbi:MAG: FMN-binding protein [Proteocatella sp.]